MENQEAETNTLAACPNDRRAALRIIAKKRRHASALHDCALTLGAIPGRERDANNVSKEAAIADAEVTQMVMDMTTNAEYPPKP